MTNERSPTAVNSSDHNNGISTVSNGRLHRKRSSEKPRKGVKLIFKDVCVTLSKKNILKKVYGMANVGQMLAVMGPSGAGKSTLLNTLTGRIPVSSGTVTLNGIPVNRHLRRKISYVMQNDIFYPALTLRETLTFQMMLRLPSSMPDELKLARMMEIVSALELTKCLDTRIGSAIITGLSGGEKKRASIACELLTNPKLLILDEPTSGLDSAIAYSLMSSLDRYAKLSHKTVVTTIHQPSSQIFHMFSNILLLNDGQVAYFGAGSGIVDFFADVGLYCEPHYNPADFIMEEVKSSAENASKLVEASLKLRYRDDWPEELKDDFTIIVDSPSNYADGEVKVVSDHRYDANPDTVDVVVPKGDVEMKTFRRRHDTFGQSESAQEVDVETYIDPEAKWQTGFMIQYLTLTKRNFMRQKDRYFSKLNFGQVLFMAVFAGLVWFRLERSEETAKDRLGILFFSAVQFGFMPCMDAINALNDETGVFMRERSAGLYRLSAYYLAVMTTEIPVNFLLPTIYTVINYWMSNLTPNGVNFVLYWLILTLSAFTAQSFGMLISVVITSRDFVMSFANTFMIGALLAGGFYNSHIADWFAWIRYVSFLGYSLNALSDIEFTQGHPFSCDPTATSFPSICTFNNTEIPGETFTKDFGVDSTPPWANLVFLFGIIIVCRVAAYIVLRFFRRPKT